LREGLEIAVFRQTYISSVGAIRLLRSYCEGQILSINSVAPGSWWSRQQPKERIRIAAGALIENSPDNKLTRMSVVMLYIKTVVLIFCMGLNGAVTPQHSLVVFKFALQIEKFDHW